MGMKRIILPLYASLILTLLTSLKVVSQPLSYPSKQENDTITSNKGHFQGNIRAYFAATDNQKQLSDYSALGMAASVEYESPLLFKYFKAGIRGTFMGNLASSNLAIPDPSTGQANRYEVGLFDVTNPGQRNDLNRLEKLYLTIVWPKNSELTIGRQLPKTPFINPQDGRLSPTFVESVAWDIRPLPKLKIHSEYIWKIAPRSTLQWYTVGQSIGIYPLGVNPEGVASQYRGNLSSGGVGIVGIVYQPGQFNFELWDTYVDNISNTNYLKAEWKSKAVARKNWFAGLQVIQQNTVSNGGNADLTETYAQPGGQSMVFSGRVGRQSPTLDIFLNATRITAQGRYLMPREWGRDPFYTFMPRERNEGFGDVTAVSVNTIFKSKKRLKVELSAGYFKLPDTKNFALNKYGIPAYAQLNADLTYRFGRYLKGLEAHFLYVRKERVGNTYGNDRYVINKVNMNHVNLILNYTF
jgi:hypothetical protein